MPSQTERQITPEEALEAVLAGKTVRLAVGDDPEDPVLLHYLDRCYQDYEIEMIYAESIGGWSEGSKEAICKPDEGFYVEFVSEPKPLSLTITDEEPMRREARYAA